jgi:5'-nucleotidase
MSGLFISRSGFIFFLLATFFWTVGCAHKIILPGDSTDISGGSLTLIHFNDGSSKLLNAGVGLEEYGGIARFATVVANLKKRAITSNALITVSAGNDFQPGQIFNVSLKNGPPYLGSTALDIIGVDAILIARHAFDMGPDVLARYISGFNRTHPVFLSSNLDFSREPSLRSLSENGVIQHSTIIERGNFKFAMIGISPPSITTLSSPRRVVVDKNLITVLQRQVNTFLKMDIQRVILIVNFDSLDAVKRLIRKTKGIDIVIAGSVNKEKHSLRHYLSAPSIPPPEYPLLIPDSTGRNVILAGTPGNFCFVGHLKVHFDSDGEVATLDRSSGISKVVGDGLKNAVPPNKEINRKIVIPLAKALSTTSRTIAVSDVLLDGEPSRVATRETNFGDLVADAILWRSAILSEPYGAAFPTIAVFKSDIFKTSLSKGRISDADVFTAISSRDSLSIVAGVSPLDLKLLLEDMLKPYSSQELDENPFPQIAGMKLVFNSTRPPGRRVKDIRLDTGDAVVLNYKVLPYAPKVNIATIGGLPPLKEPRRQFNNVKKINLGVLPQNAVIAYLSGSAKNGALNGKIEKKRYPATGLRRIMVTRE